MSNSLTPKFLTKQPLPNSLVTTIRLLGEYKGKQQLYMEQSPQALETLRRVAMIESAQSSNRIEGVTASPERIRSIVTGDAGPREVRSEQEIAGYRDVLKTIHASATDIPIKPSVILQLHRDLFRFVHERVGGRWKGANNDIIETLADGRTRLRFRPVAAHLTAQAMERLCASYRNAIDSEESDPLVLIPAFVLDFLCIHPFADGNGRIARLLTLLLLYQAGYEVGRFISLERVVEQTKQGYYESLYISSQDWHEGRHSLKSWSEYFLGVMLLTAYREFEHRVGTVTEAWGAKSAMVRDAIERLPRRFTIGELQRACPAISRATITRVLYALKGQGKVRCLSLGRGAQWERLGG